MPTKKSKSKQSKHYATKKYTNEVWVIDIFDELQKLSAIEVDLQNSRAFCICQVPDSLSSSKPEAFIPKFVGLGPYHHFRANLTLRKDLKLAAAKRVLTNLPNDIDAFHQLVTHYPSDTKDLYHLDVESAYNPHTLSYVLTVDGLFLLAFVILLSRSKGEGFSYFLTGKLGMPLFNAAGVELTKNALIREVFMLENQIPFHVLKQINGVNGCKDKSDEQIQSEEQSLGSVLNSFCKEHSPLVNSQEHPENPEKFDHLLDLMYQLIVPASSQSEPVRAVSKKDDQPPRTDPPTSQVINNYINKIKNLGKFLKKEANLRCYRCCSICCHILVFLPFMCFIVALVAKFIIKEIYRVLLSLSLRVGKAFLVLCHLLKIFASWFNPVFGAIHQTLTDLEADYPSVKPYRKFVGALDNATRKQEKGSADDSSDEDVGPVVMIPSVRELHRAGIIFQPAEGSMLSIQFDEKGVFYLPCIKLDVNSEVIMRNLMAYESLTKPYSLIFTRYTELMRAIIDTPEDVKLLVHAQIIQTELSYDVVANLFNGMSKSIRKNTRTPKLDKVIKKVSAKFDSAQKRKRAVTKYTSVKFITVIGSLVFLALTAMQTYCSVHNCSRITN